MNPYPARPVAEAPSYGEERLIALELTLVTGQPRSNPSVYGMRLDITAHMTNGDRNGSIQL